MKIGILTFHCAHNYGAVLQCYALQQVLISMGYEVEVVDYRPQYLLQPYKIFDSNKVVGTPVEKIKSFMMAVLKMGKRLKKSKSFNSFITKRLKLSCEREFQTISDKYDVYIVGSDQVWNVNLTGGAIDKVYFMDLPFEKGKRRYISYAASMGGYNIYAGNYVDYIKQALGNFDAISLREERMIDQLQPLLPEKKMKDVLDPTLIADGKIWEKIVKKPKIKKKYVLVYRFTKDKNILRMAHRIASAIGGVVVEISLQFNICFGNEIYKNASPEEFLGWFKYADYVITTSFHGTAFSIIFQRPFYCIRYNNEHDYRSESLLEKLCLQDRMICAKESVNISDIDYSTISPLLASLREESMAFLNENLK